MNYKNAPTPTNKPPTSVSGTFKEYELRLMAAATSRTSSSVGGVWRVNSDRASDSGMALESTRCANVALAKATPKPITNTMKFIFTKRTKYIRCQRRKSQASVRCMQAVRREYEGCAARILAMQLHARPRAGQLPCPCSCMPSRGRATSLLKRGRSGSTGGQKKNKTK